MHGGDPIQPLPQCKFIKSGPRIETPPIGKCLHSLKAIICCKYREIYVVAVRDVADAFRQNKIGGGLAVLR